MRKVIGIGETVLDIIFKNGKPIEAVPGGSSFNAVISLGRSGVNASFISEAGNDRIGEYVIQFTEEKWLRSLFGDSFVSYCNRIPLHQRRQKNNYRRN